LLELVDEIPLSGPGKVNRKLLREWAARQAGADPDATAGTASAGKEEESS
jgi:acyl-CoA synthetase (AMP-forming)/AMP-acid ligase II